MNKPQPEPNYPRTWPEFREMLIGNLFAWTGTALIIGTIVYAPVAYRAIRDYRFPVSITLHIERSPQ